MNIRNYAKYILQEGTREEKREIIACLDTTIFIKDSQIYIKEKVALPAGRQVEKECLL